MRSRIPSRSIRCCLWTVAAIGIVLSAPPPSWRLSAQSSSAPELTEYQKKAVWILHIFKSTDWPSGAFAQKSSALVLGILGEDPFGPVIDGMTNQVVAGRPIAIKRFDNLQELQPCHVLFVCASENESLADLFKQLKDSPVITVGETKEFTKEGGMINLSFSDRYAFEISKRAYQNSGLKIDSRFLVAGKLVP